MQIGDGSHCISLPGGAEVCFTPPSIIPMTGLEQMLALLGQLNSALAPLQPIFNIIDAVVAVYNCIEAISTLDPTEILNCIPDLAEKIQKLLMLLPQFALPFTILDIIDTLISLLEGYHHQLSSMSDYIDRILAAELAAAEPGNISIGLFVSCANADVDAFFKSLNESTKPVNRLIGLVNFFLDLIGVPFCIPPLGAFEAPFLDEILALLQQLIDLLRLLRGLIQIPGLPPATNSKSCD